MKKLILGGLLAAVLLPTLPAQADKEFSPANIDKAIRTEWKKEKIIPASPVDDARFLRRVYLDISGTIPPAEVVTEFLDNKSPYKRLEAINRLLESPRYVEYWTGYWDDILMGRQVRSQVVDRLAFRKWIEGQVRTNAPYNKFVYELLTASGQNSTGISYAKMMGLKGKPGEMMEAESATGSGDASKINGAVNWYLKYAQTPADLSGNASRIFMGVQIQCAQCHDHKTEKWKQEDFRKFTSCFMQARPVPVDKTRIQGAVRRVDLQDRPMAGRFRRQMANKVKENGRAEYEAASPAALDGSDFSSSPNRRKALAEWITADSNPWFAKAIVNRMWAHFLGRGFVDPVDDFRETNPAVMPELLLAIAEDFKANNYDMKHLIRTICTTQVYQLSSTPAKKADPGNTLWARYRLKPMGPETMLDSLVSATNMGTVLEKVAGNNLTALKLAITRQFTFLFDVDEEFEQKEFEGTIPQALMLLNGNLVNSGASAIPGTALAEVLGMPGGDEAKIESLYLRTLSRRPTTSEISYWREFVNAPRGIVQSEGPPPALPLRGRMAAGAGKPGQADKKALQQALSQKGARKGLAPDPLNRLNGARFTNVKLTPKQQAFEDVFWTLLNSSEFLFNH